MGGCFMETIVKKDISAVSKLIINKEVSPVELTEYLIEKSLKCENNSFITVSETFALKEAKEVEQAILEGDYKGGLQGIPISIKDNINVKNLPTTNGANVDPEYVPRYDASIVAQLRSQ